MGALADSFSTAGVVVPAKAGIQYAAASRLHHNGLWNTGSPPRSLSSGGHSADPVAGMRTEHDFAISRRDPPEVLHFVAL
jgi:hypothetical protein